jgi:hypothetical protein
LLEQQLVWSKTEQSINDLFYWIEILIAINIAFNSKKLITTTNSHKHAYLKRGSDYYSNDRWSLVN